MSNDIMLSLIMLSVNMLSVNMLSVIMLSVAKYCMHPLLANETNAGYWICSTINKVISLSLMMRQNKLERLYLV